MSMQTPTGFALSCIALALSLYGAGMASAQEFRATITGRVTDPNGLVVPGATVTAANSQTGEVAVGTTTTEGVYTIPFLRPGVYTVSAELTGFRKVSQPNVRLEVGQTSAVNFQLPLGQLSEDITVSAESPLLETSKADRGLVIDNERVTELPLNARNPFMYLNELGRAIGEEVAPLRALTSEGRYQRSILVRRSVREAMTADRINIITERPVAGAGVDLIVATNVLSYFDDQQVALALSNIAALLRPGGYLLHNESRKRLAELAGAIGLPVLHMRTAVLGGPAARPLYDAVWLHQKLKAPR